MTELKKIVVEGFPVERLPEELKTDLEQGRPVRITLEQSTDGAEVPPLVDMYGFAHGLYASQGVDPAEYIRNLRDEWE